VIPSVSDFRSGVVKSSARNLQFGMLVDYEVFDRRQRRSGLLQQYSTWIWLQYESPECDCCLLQSRTCTSATSSAEELGAFLPHIITS